MSSSYNVLHVITGLERGGAELMLARLACAMRPRGFSSEVVSLMQSGPVATTLLDAGVQVHSLGLRPGQASPFAAIRLSRLAREMRPDIIHGWMYHGNLAATWAAWSLSGAPIIWNVRHSLHDLELEPPFTKFLIRMGARLSRGPAAIVYNSKTSAKQHEKLGYSAPSTVVIPNGFDCDRFRPRQEARERLRLELAVPPSATLIGMVARDHPMKDVGNLLKAIPILQQQGVDVRLAVVGRGHTAVDSDAAKLIGDLGVGETVRLLGEREDVHEILPAFDILALPSAWGEGFPNVLGEAMASGVPCVATDVGDSRWVVGEHGLVVKPRDAAAFAEALRELVELGPDGRQRLGEAGRARVVSEFALASVANRYADLSVDLMDRVAALRRAA